MSNFTSLDPAPGENFYTSSKDVNLNDITTTITTIGYGRVNLYSDDTTPLNRSIFLQPSDLEGQQLTLTLLSGSSTTCLLSTISTSYVRLTEAWTPVEYGQITLQWIKGLWIEMTRTVEGNPQFNPDVTNPQDGDLLIYDTDTWVNHDADGLLTLNGSGEFDFRNTTGLQENDTLMYNGTNWVNQSSPALTWEACTTLANWSGTIEVAKYSSTIIYLRGTLTSTNGTNSDMITVPSGYEHATSIIFGSFGTGSLSTITTNVLRITGDSIAYANPGTVSTGATVIFNGTDYFLG